MLFLLCRMYAVIFATKKNCLSNIILASLRRERGRGRLHYFLKLSFFLIISISYVVQFAAQNKS